MKLILKESQLSLSEGSVVNILGLVGLTLEMFPKSISSLQIVLEAGKVPMLHLSSYVPDFEIQEDPVQNAYDAAILAVAQTITRSVATAKKETREAFCVLKVVQEDRAIRACKVYKQQWNTWLAQRQMWDMYYYHNLTWTFNFDRKW